MVHYFTNSASLAPGRVFIQFHRIHTIEISQGKLTVGNESFLPKRKAEHPKNDSLGKDGLKTSFLGFHV
jgi:hypothetical protein